MARSRGAAPLAGVRGLAPGVAGGEGKIMNQQRRRATSVSIHVIKVHPPRTESRYRVAV